MRKNSASAFAIVFFATLASCANVDMLSVSGTSGKAPFKVRITGPENLTKLAQNKWNKWVGCEFSIDWGEASPATGGMRDCASYFEHTYKTPGIYTVTASTFHPNPDDSHTQDWAGKVKITVK